MLNLLEHALIADRLLGIRIPRDFKRALLHWSLMLLWLSGTTAFASEVEKLKLEAEAGVTSAQCLLGKAYLYGEGTPQNFSNAVFWLRKASAAVDQTAQLLLAKCFDAGHGVPRSEAHYLGILRKLANEGNLAGQHLLGLRLTNKAVSRLWDTNSVPIKVEAYKWLCLAGAKDPSVNKDRELIRSEMSGESIGTAQRLAELFKPAQPTPLVFTDNWQIVVGKTNVASTAKPKSRVESRN